MSFCSQGGGLHSGGGLHPEGGSASGGLHLGGGGSAFGGVGQTSHPDTMGYGQRAGSTHPTGMHSCFAGVCLFMVRVVVARYITCNMG